WIDARKSATGGLADPGIAIILRRLERGDGVLGLFAKVPQAVGGAHADVGVLVLEDFDQGRHDLGRLALALRQDANRNKALKLILPFQIFEQLVGRFFPAAALRQQAKQQKQSYLQAHSFWPPSP